MRRKTTLLALSMLLSLAGFATTTRSQQGGRRAIVDSGVVSLVAGQKLRLTIDGGSGNDTLTVRFRRMYYVGTANGGVWKSSVAAEDTSAPITIASDEAVSTDASPGGFDAVRIEAIIRGYTGATHVNTGVLQIINSDGSVAAFFDIFPEIS